MNLRLERTRRFKNALAVALACLATLLGLGFLASILFTTLQRGIAAFGTALFVRITAHGAEGGLANAMVGSVIIDLMAILIAAPIGVAAGTWLAEYAARTRLGAFIRFMNDILLSAPSIVLGLFIYMVVVLPMTAATDGAVSFSALAGALALALIALPVIVRSTDEMLRLVPASLREAALSLGVPQWKLTVQVLLRAASSGILTGILLALARLAGETAPLLFTAFGNNYMAYGPLDKMATLPTTIYQYTNDPDPAMHAIAWAGALLVTVFVLALGLLARTLVHRGSHRHD
ncbi:MAG TPA: phosphate ABC transporter permease PstA [Chiayiivirga sp.]|nr:phosphate ABC transporter permease PstA [Chiayiivirga sp.]